MPVTINVANVYFKKVSSSTSIGEIKEISKKLLDTVIKQEKVALEKEIPLKVHFGEPGNITFIKPENYDGIIDYLDRKGIKTSYMETNVLYGGQRFKKELHLKTAEKHGFTRVPVIIADGDHGELYDEIEINKKHFQKCKLGKEFSNYSQLIVIAHFKGHGLAGFGGAIKQLAMGHASKGGKLAMHMGIKPKIINRKCDKCDLCLEVCAEDAITIGEKCFIDHEKCMGCGACVAVCPNKAVSIISLRGIANALKGSDFREKIAEYAYAAQKGKNNIYINYSMNITSGCDCVGRKMKPLMDDIGIYASTDPVAIDKACWDAVKDSGKKFKGSHQFDYAEEIGLGTTKYVLKEI